MSVTPSAGLHDLRHLSLGWCRDVGDTRRDVTNNIAALAQLTTLRELSLAGTKVCDGQLAAVIPQLTNIQVTGCNIVVCDSVLPHCCLLHIMSALFLKRQFKTCGQIIQSHQDH